MKTIAVDLHIPAHSLDRPTFVLRHDLVVLRLRVPAGFESDAATTPRLLWALFPPVGKWTQAAIAHDYLLKDGMPRDYADKFFLRALQKHDQVHPVVARLMYWAVRLRTAWVALFGR